MAYDFTVDPFTQVYKSLWAILEANSTFASLVKPGNRIKYDGTSENPEKFEAMYADMNEVEIYPMGREDEVVSSAHYHITKVYEIRISTPSTRLDTKLHPLAWKIMQIFKEAADGGFSAKATAAGITYDMGYVKGCRLRNYVPAKDDPELIRGVNKWTARLQVAVEMSIHREQLTA